MDKNTRLALIRDIVANRNEEIGAKPMGLVLATEFDERDAFVTEFNHSLKHEVETEDEAVEMFDTERFSTDRKDNANDTNEA